MKQTVNSWICGCSWVPAANRKSPYQQSIDLVITGQNAGLVNIKIWMDWGVIVFSFFSFSFLIHYSKLCSVKVGLSNEMFYAFMAWFQLYGVIFHGPYFSLKWKRQTKMGLLQTSEQCLAVFTRCLHRWLNKPNISMAYTQFGIMKKYFILCSPFNLISCLLCLILILCFLQFFKILILLANIHPTLTRRMHMHIRACILVYAKATNI